MTATAPTGRAMRWYGRVARWRFILRGLRYRITDRAGYRREW